MDQKNNLAKKANELSGSIIHWTEEVFWSDMEYESPTETNLLRVGIFSDSSL